MSGNLSYLQVLQSSLPDGYVPDLTEQNYGSETLHIVDRLLRFACGGACPEDASDATRKEWEVKQVAVQKALQDLAAGKRKRGEDGDAQATPDAKRARVSEEKDDAPLYTLHAISVSSPIRKKVDISVHARSLRLVHPSTTISVPRSAITNAFLLPTRGKAKPHWTVVLLTDDVSESAKTVSSSTQKAKTPDKTQIIFGVEATPSAAFMTSTYPAIDVPSKETHPKSTPTLPVLRTFLETLGVVAHEPSTSVFKSTIPDMINPGESGSPSLTAYLGAKPGTLYFFDSGLLWGETKPFMWWPLQELAPMEEEEGSLRGGVRVVWAGGRLCTIVLSRGMEGEEHGTQELDEGEETHLGMVDAKEKEGVEVWVRKYKRWFGKVRGGVNGAAGSPTKGMDKGNGKVEEVAEEEDEDDDEDDDDFAADSESDGGSPSEGSSDEDGEGDQEGEEGEAMDEDEDANEEEEEGDLDPASHPLMRPGAMPKMSKGVIDMVAGIVEQEFLGVGDGREEEEEDELED